MSSPSPSPPPAGSFRRTPRLPFALAGAALLLALALPALPAAEGLLDPLPNRLSEATRWLRGYLRIDTSNPPGNESSAAKYLEGILRAEGIETEIVELEPGRGNLVARLRGTGARPTLVLNHHVDVVPPGNGRWKFPPFAAAIRDLRLYGRGVIDDKGRGMSQVAALVALRRSGVPLDRDVVLLATADEETGGRLGVRGLLERRPELVRGAVGVLGEGGVNDVVVDKVQLWKIEISQKRPLWLRVEARGEAGHGAVPSPGAASHRLLRALGRILAWSPEPAASDLVSDCLRQWAPAKAGRKREILLDIRRALRENPREIGVFFGTSMEALFAPTVAIGRFEGSSSINVLPAVARAEVDLRIRPEDDAEAIVATLRDLVKPDRVEISVLESSPPVPASPVSGELYRALADFLPTEEPGSVVAPSISPGFTDGRFFRQAGIPTYGFSPLKVNYYDMSGIHGTDEKIRVDFFDESVARMSRFLERFCGAPAPAAR